MVAMPQAAQRSMPANTLVASAQAAAQAAEALLAESADPALAQDDRDVAAAADAWPDIAARHGLGTARPVLVGHSAGGHLAARMICEDSPLKALDRVARCLPDVQEVVELVEMSFRRTAGVRDIARLDAR